MFRPAAVTAAAVVGILGSLLVLGFGAAMATISVTQPYAASDFRAVGIGMGTVACVLAVIGVATAIALLRMRAWARTSVLVFAGFTAVCLAFALITVPFVPPPSAAGAAAEAPVPVSLRTILIVFYLLPLGIAVWWLIYFTRPSTKAAFEAAAGAPIESARPLSISIMGWSSLITGAASLLPLFTTWPAFLFGMVFTGVAAKIVYAGFAGFSIYIGWGLLRLRNGARIAGLAWCAYTVVQAAVMLLVPHARARMRAFDVAGLAARRAPLGDRYLAATMIAMIAFSALAAWYLVRARPAFTKVETATVA